MRGCWPWSPHISYIKNGDEGPAGLGLHPTHIYKNGDEGPAGLGPQSPNCTSLSDVDINASDVLGLSIVGNMLDLNSDIFHIQVHWWSKEYSEWHSCHAHLAHALNHDAQVPT